MSFTREMALYSSTKSPVKAPTPVTNVPQFYYHIFKEQATLYWQFVRKYNDLYPCAWWIQLKSRCSADSTRRSQGLLWRMEACYWWNLQETENGDNGVDIEAFKKLMIAEYTAFLNYVDRVCTHSMNLSEIRRNIWSKERCWYEWISKKNYWNDTAVTLHPMVVYYRTTDDGELSRKGYVLSEELAHTTTAVYVSLNNYVTDSPTSQYRKITIFHKKLFGVPASWFYFEAGHDKWPCDGIGGAAKRSARYAVKLEILSLGFAPSASNNIFAIFRWRLQICRTWSFGNEETCHADQGHNAITCDNSGLWRTYISYTGHSMSMWNLCSRMTGPQLQMECFLPNAQLPTSSRTYYGYES